MQLPELLLKAIRAHQTGGHDDGRDLEQILPPLIAECELLARRRSKRTMENRRLTYEFEGAPLGH